MAFEQDRREKGIGLRGFVHSDDERATFTGAAGNVER
jgi:hypothetical protein